VNICIYIDMRVSTTWFIIKNPIKLMIWGYHQFQETSIWSHGVQNQRQN
jgi:hypothetical protein